MPLPREIVNQIKNLTEEEKLNLAKQLQRKPKQGLKEHFPLQTSVEVTVKNEYGEPKTFTMWVWSCGRHRLHLFDVAPGQDGWEKKHPGRKAAV